MACACLRTPGPSLETVSEVSRRSNHFSFIVKKKGAERHAKVWARQEI